MKKELRQEESEVRCKENLKKKMESNKKNKKKKEVGIDSHGDLDM